MVIFGGGQVSGGANILDSPLPPSVQWTRSHRPLTRIFTGDRSASRRLLLLLLLLLVPHGRSVAGGGHASSWNWIHTVCLMAYNANAV